jgi:hypothetical protein
MLLTLASASASAQAQQTSASEGEFSVQRFEPAIGPRNFLSVEGARTDGEFAFSLGAMFNYAHNPFVVRSCRSQTNCDEPNSQNLNDVVVIRDYFQWDVLASLTPHPRVQIGVRVPFAMVKGDGIDLSDGSQADQPLDQFALGDPTLEAKFRLVGGATDPFVIGLAADVSTFVGHLMTHDDANPNRSTSATPRPSRPGCAASSTDRPAPSRTP